MWLLFSGAGAPLSTLYNVGAPANDTIRLEGAAHGAQERVCGMCEKAPKLAGGAAPCYTLTGNLAVLREMRRMNAHPRETETS